jgi:hypothetical protein
MISARGLYLSILATLSLNVALPLAAMAQAGAGVSFDARDPATCPDKSAPTVGPITADLAAQYVTCEEESASYITLQLVDQMKVQVGAPRAFQFETDSSDNVDSSQPVYPIRGSYVRYRCSHPNAAVGTVGKNCSLYDQPNASGSCTKTTFGDWYCQMKDLDNTLKQLANEVPAPC